MFLFSQQNSFAPISQNQQMTLIQSPIFANRFVPSSPLGTIFFLVQHFLRSVTNGCHWFVFSPLRALRYSTKPRNMVVDNDDNT